MASCASGTSPTQASRRCTPPSRCAGWGRRRACQRVPPPTAQQAGGLPSVVTPPPASHARHLCTQAAPGGPGSGPTAEITHLAWNRKVQHILASTGSDGACVVWDLKKQRPIISLRDQNSQRRCSAVQWNPEVATQLVVASDDDRSPTLQMWDLRNSASPIAEFVGHTKVHARLVRLRQAGCREAWPTPAHAQLHVHTCCGRSALVGCVPSTQPTASRFHVRVALWGGLQGALSMAWCQADPTLLLSSAKDNRVVCWDVTTTDIVCEMAATNNPVFDVAVGGPAGGQATAPAGCTPRAWQRSQVGQVHWCKAVQAPHVHRPSRLLPAQWCPTQPGAFVTASYDGKVSMHQLATCTGGEVVETINADFSVSRVPSGERGTRAPCPLCI